MKQVYVKELVRGMFLVNLGRVLSVDFYVNATIVHFESGQGHRFGKYDRVWIQ